MKFFLLLRYDTVVENLLDPSHVPFVHHGVESKRENARKIELRLQTGFSSMEGFSRPNSEFFLFENIQSGFHFEFIPPVLVKLEFPRATSNLLCVPTGPSSTRVITISLSKAKGNNRILKLFLEFYRKIKLHLYLNEIFDGDTTILHRQEVILRHASKPNKSFCERYFMPSKADFAVQTFRLWLETRGGNGPRSNDGSLLLKKRGLELRRELILDR